MSERHKNTKTKTIKKGVVARNVSRKETHHDIRRIIILDLRSQINANLNPVLRILLFDSLQQRMEPLCRAKVTDDPSEVNLGQPSRLRVVEIVHAVPNRLQDPVVVERIVSTLKANRQQEQDIRFRKKELLHCSFYTRITSKKKGGGEQGEETQNVHPPPHPGGHANVVNSKTTTINKNKQSATPNSQDPFFPFRVNCDDG